MKILIGIVAVLACFYMAESLDCNKCAISLFGYCFVSGTETCSTNTSVCYAVQFTFDSLSSWKGASRQGCSESSLCPIDTNSTTTTTTTNGTIDLRAIQFDYTIKTQCCSTDKCNSVDLSGDASVNTMSMSAVLSAAALAVVSWSHM